MAHKPLRAIRVLPCNHEPYCGPSVGCGQLPVERMEPHWPRKLKMCGFLEEKPSRYSATATAGTAVHRGGRSDGPGPGLPPSPLISGTQGKGTT